MSSGQAGVWRAATATRPSLTTMERLLIGAHGADDDAVRRGMRWLRDQPLDQGARPGVVVPDLNSARALAQALGDTDGQLVAARRVAMGDGVAAELLLASTLPAAFAGPLLAVWVDDGQMEKLERARPVAIFAITWNKDDLEHWDAAWAPADPRAGIPAGGPPALSNPVVTEAMEDLTARVNLSTGIGHPSDRSAAVAMFGLLQDAGEPYEPAEIRAWATAHGWRPDHARRLAEIGEKFKAGRRVQGRGRGTAWSADVLARWRERARENAPPEAQHSSDSD
jgi:hypothetical protein